MVFATAAVQADAVVAVGIISSRTVVPFRTFCSCSTVSFRKLYVPNRQFTCLTSRTLVGIIFWTFNFNHKLRYRTTTDSNRRPLVLVPCLSSPRAHTVHCTVFSIFSLVRCRATQRTDRVEPTNIYRVHTSSKKNFERPGPTSAYRIALPTNTG